MRSCDKLKTYPHYHNAYGHQTRRSRPQIWMTPQLWGLLSSRDKLNISYLQLKMSHGHKTSQGSDLPWKKVTTIKARLPLDHVTNLRPRDNLKKKYIFTLTSLIATKLGRVLTLSSRSSTQMFNLSRTFCHQHTCVVLNMVFHMFSCHVL